MPHKALTLPADIRETDHYKEASAIYHAVRRPGSGLISDAVELSTDGMQAVYAGTLVDSLDGVLPTRLCATDLTTGATKVLTYGPRCDRNPRHCPDGPRVAFLSDRGQKDDYQLYLLDLETGAAQAAPIVPGWIESLEWSPDGSRILLRVAGHGADRSGVQGATTSQSKASCTEPWMPQVAPSEDGHRWRSVWVFDMAAHTVLPVPLPRTNVWEAVWCGRDRLAAVVSDDPDEAQWYSAQLQIVDLSSAQSGPLYLPEHQVGCLASSPTGRMLAFVEAICSDRGVVAGQLRLVDPSCGQLRQVDTLGVDISCIEWRSDFFLLLAGHRGFDRVVLIYDLQSNTAREVWASSELSTGGIYFSVAGCGSQGDCVLIAEGFARAPEIATIRDGIYRSVKSFDVGYAEYAQVIGSTEPLTWIAPDDLPIQGWLLRPHSVPPHPLVMYIHGGPVWHWHPFWLGRRAAAILMLLARGFAIFFPNPRGSTGRGQEFAARVVGDMGGADTYDYLSGLDQLIQRRVVDPKRLGVTGTSYGGFMTAWLSTQDARFSAAVPVAPIANHVTEHLLSNISHFVRMFLADQYHNVDGKYQHRSPVMYAHQSVTPTLNVCGALDRCTPPEEAAQFHSALTQAGVESVLVTYPQEGHGIREWPASIDYAARVVAWFEQHCSAPRDAQISASVFTGS